jgi:hypothetical protein
MKNALYLILLYLPIFVKAQNTCRGNPDGYVFNPNKIQAFFTPQGEKFYSPEHGGFNAPFPVPNYSNSTRTINSGAPWIGSFTDGKLYIAAQRYSQTEFHDNDYYNGPLDSNGLKFIDECHLFDRVWNVFREDVLRHVDDFQDNGKIDDTIPAIFGWPAEGNQYFSRFNGFQLPLSHQGGWAAFDDLNLNGIYDPHLGEYPGVMFQGTLIHPDQIMWMVFNDQGDHHITHSMPLGVEIQLTVFGYYCEDNTLLNHSLFNNYKIINQSQRTLDSLFFGQFHDYEIGCDEDDYVGCDSIRHTEFAYNADSLDGQDSWCFSGAGGYGGHTPIQSLTYLSHPMYSYIKETSFQISQVSIEFYRMLTGHWRNGAPITVGGNGQGTDPGLTTTRFIYPGDPRDPNAWSELAIGATPARTSSISSVYLDQLEAGEQITVECVYIFHQDTSLSYLEQFGSMYTNLDNMTSMVSDLDNACDPFPVCLDKDCVWPGDFNHDDIVDHRDLLYWGVTEGATGQRRNGLVSWRGQYADDWTKAFSDGTNAKHQDADGDGIIGKIDLQYNLNNFFNTTPDYIVNDRYPAGPELVIVSDPMEEDGDIGNLRVMSRRPLKDMYGISFELEFDTFFHNYTILLQKQPLDTLGVRFVGGNGVPYYDFYQGENNGDTRYSFVSTAHENYNIQDSFYFLRIPFGLKNKHQLPLEYLPDQFVFRLKNLVAINKDGDDLDFGAVPYIVYNPFTTAVDQLELKEIKVFPNPASDFLYVETAQTTEARIYTIHGNVIRHFTGEELSQPIDVSKIPPGIYLLRIMSTGEAIKLILH